MAKSKKIITEYRPYELSTTFPVLLLSGDKWYISEIKSGRLHFHNCLEIGICLSHKGFMEFAGKKQEFEAGDITCVPRYLQHTTYSATSAKSFWSYMFFDTDVLFQRMSNNASLISELSMVDFTNFQYIMPKEQYPMIHFLATKAASELECKPPHYQDYAASLLFNLCMEILRVQKQLKIVPAEITKTPNDNSLVILPALDYIEKNYMHQFSIDYLAELCHLSGTHFRRIFNETIGTSPLDFTNHTRIKKACAFLKTSQESILYISEQVGFHSISSFNRCFSGYMGTSPRDWRKQVMLLDGKVEVGSVVEYQGWMYPEL